jgi:hypothetical protein
MAAATGEDQALRRPPPTASMVANLKDKEKWKAQVRVEPFWNIPLAPEVRV